MGRVNDDVVRYPAAADQTARQPEAVFTLGVNSADIAALLDGIQYLKGTPAGAAHVSLRDNFGNAAGLQPWTDMQRASLWDLEDPWSGGVKYYG